MSLLTKEELKWYKNLESYKQLTSGWVSEVKIKPFLNYLSKLPWLLNWSERNIFLSPLYCSIPTN